MSGRIEVRSAGEHRRMPWKNGSGETIEIAVYPQSASLDTFAWRVSMAAVIEPGPFSTFADVDRTLAVLDGNGLKLTIDGKTPQTLTQTSPPLLFPADVGTDATLIDGPIRDLNVMTRRGIFSHRVDRVAAAATAVTLAPAALWLLLCHSGQADIATSEGARMLQPLDAAVGYDAPCTLSASDDACLYYVRLVRH
jgi:uncharacterized protein